MTPCRVVVVGPGVAPALAATALRRAFARAGLEVTWVETPGDAAGDAAILGLPNLRSFHRLLGLDSADVLRAAGGSFALGRLYAGFAGAGGEHLHSYGQIGRPIAGLPFVQFWLKARAAGLPAGFADFAREAVAARHGRIRIAEDATGAASAYGYHLDARRYAELLRSHAGRQGVKILGDTAPQGIVDGDRIAAVRLSGGRQLPADLVVDATPAATVLTRLGDGAPEASGVSGCTRMLVGSGRALHPLPLYSRVVAHRAGWSALYPLRDRTGIAVAFDGERMSDEDAATLSGVPLATEPALETLDPFQRRRPWIGNVVAIGGAMGRHEPIGATWLHRVQIAVTHLIALFPVRRDTMPEADIFNEELAGWHARLIDFDAALYALNSRVGEPFWDEARARAITHALAGRIDLFGARGMVAQYNQDSVTEDEWQARFLEMGVAPRSWDPQVDRVDERVAMTDFRDLLAAIRADVTAMDSHDGALARATMP